MLVGMIPDFMVRIFARPYVAGDSIAEALEVAATLLQEAQILSTLDLLAEEVTEESRIQENRNAYLELLEQIEKDPRFRANHQKPTVSLKVSSFTAAPLDQGGDARGADEFVRGIAEAARQRDIGLTIDMEDHSWTDYTLDLAIDLYQSGFDVGTVLQSRLHRTASDLARIPEGMRIRTVIGIYQEPSKIALTDKRAMKRALVEQSLQLLKQGAYVEFGTHDDHYIRDFLHRIPGEFQGRFELQLLFGVPRTQIIRQVRTGELCEAGVPPIRLYVPFATAWDQATAYCRRRLQANPDIAFYVAKNLLGTVLGRRPGLSQYIAVGRNGSD